MHPMLNIAVRAARCTGNVIIFVWIMLAEITSPVFSRRVYHTTPVTFFSKLLLQTKPLNLLRCLNAGVRLLMASSHFAGHPDNRQYARAGLICTRTPANRFPFTTSVLSLSSDVLLSQPYAARSKEITGVYGHFG